MYIFRMTSGELRDAPEDFSPDAPDFEQLADVEEVLVIGKVLVKQLRLVSLTFRRSQRIEGFPDARHQAEVRGSIAFLVHGVLRSPHIV